MTQRCSDSAVSPMLCASAVRSAAKLPPPTGFTGAGRSRTGVSREKDLPDELRPGDEAKDNLIWKAPFGGRSAPLVMDGRVYIIKASGEGLNEGERVVCFDEKTGKSSGSTGQRLPHRHRLQPPRLDDADRRPGDRVRLRPRHRRAPALPRQGRQGRLAAATHRGVRPGHRLRRPHRRRRSSTAGWSSSAWSTPAGATRPAARTASSPSTARPGKVVWWSTPAPTRSKAPTTPTRSSRSSTASGCSSPAGADGACTPSRSAPARRCGATGSAAGVVNGSPVVDGNLVYCRARRREPRGRPDRPRHLRGRRQVDPKTKKPKLVWEYRQA